MKRLLKTIICILICISALFSMISCDLINYFFDRDVDGPHPWHEGCVAPDGYTGGTDIPRVQLVDFLRSYIIVWFETYDELMEAVNLTKSYGTEIATTPYFDVEEYGIDIKFQVLISREMAKANLSNNGSYFAGKIDTIYINNELFFEFVEIPVLEYSYRMLYSGFYVVNTPEIPLPEEGEKIEISKDSFTNVLGRGSYSISYGGEVRFRIEETSSGQEETSAETLEILEQNLKFIQ